MPSRTVTDHYQPTPVKGFASVSVHEADKTQSKHRLQPSTTSLVPTHVQNALLVNDARKYEICPSFPIPEQLGDDEVMIRNFATGLNPIDWKSLEYNFCLPEFPWITGREMAGVVEKVGRGVTDFKVGSRVWTSTYYKDRRAGCFQDLVVVPQHTVCAIPSNLDYESAACLGVGGLTAAMTLWQWMRIPMYPSPPQASSETDSEFILIWGGSAVTGQFAIQLSVLAGIDVITVCSAQSEALVRSLGAKHAVVRDGKSDEAITEEIRSIGGDHITKGIDLVGSKTANILLTLLSKSKPSLLAPVAMMSVKSEVDPNVEIVNIEMKRFVLDPTSKRYSERLNELIENGSIKLPQLEVIKGGLYAIEEGLRRLREERMSGKKLIVTFEEQVGRHEGS